MNSTTNGRDEDEEEILADEISDEALEAAAGTESEKAGNYTICLCTYMNICRSW
jgi:hypothetical protein